MKNSFHSRNRQPIRVCFMIDRLGMGGTETQLLELVRHLDRSVVQPYLVLLDGSDDSSRSLEPNDVPVLRLGVSSLLRPRTIWKAVCLRKFLRQHRIDVLQVHFADSTYLGVPVARLARVPCVIKTRRDLVYWTTPTHRRFGRPLDRLYNRFLVDAMFVNSLACQQAAIKDESMVANRIRLVPNGVDLARYAQNGHANNGSRRTKCVGIVANLRPVKDIPVFIRAAKLLSASHPDVHFAVAGDGPMRRSLQTLIEEVQLNGRFSLRGLVHDVPKFLAELDVAVLCSESEGMPNAIIEYMAAGKPIVATAVGGNVELIQHSKTGLLVKPKDPRDLANAISSLLRQPQLATRMGNAARCQLADANTFQSVARRYESYYLDLTSRNLK